MVTGKCCLSKCTAIFTFSAFAFMSTILMSINASKLQRPQYQGSRQNPLWAERRLERSRCEMLQVAAHMERHSRCGIVVDLFTASTKAGFTVIYGRLQLEELHANE